jgi:hypothetical protein
MRRIPGTATALALLALSALVTVPPMAAAAPAPTLTGKAAGGGHATASPRVCYEQRDNDNGSGIVSQNFETPFDAYDSRGADDFEIDRACRLTYITVDGTYFDGAGVVDSVNVTIYRARRFGPGQVELRRPGRPYNDCGNGCLQVAVKGKLAAGSHWVSVQANMDFNSGGEWGWLTNNTVRGIGAVWKNPGDGFATGCTAYTDLLTCIPVEEGGDLAFSIQ